VIRRLQDFREELFVAKESRVTFHMQVTRMGMVNVRTWIEKLACYLAVRPANGRQPGKYRNAIILVRSNRPLSFGIRVPASVHGGTAGRAGA
jgi:hypothetical protein